MTHDLHFWEQPSTTYVVPESLELTAPKTLCHHNPSTGVACQRAGAA